MEEKRYLTLFNKIGYGTGDLAAGMVYGIVTSFVMIYLTNTIGMSPGIVGTLIMLSKIFDGVSDIVFGTLIDRTHSRMGKARPWMLFSYIGNFVCLILLFAIPQKMSSGAQYVYFFVAYVLLNSVFYTANSISYSALTSLITKNSQERVQLGSFRAVFSLIASIMVLNGTLRLVNYFGGGAAGWRNVAIVYAFVGLVINTISVLSVKELPEETKAESTLKVQNSGFLKTFAVLLKNPFFDMLAVLYVLGFICSSILMGVAVYYFMYIIGDENVYGTFMTMSLFPSLLAMLAIPFLVKRMNSIRNVNLISFSIQIIFRMLFIFAAIAKNVPAMTILYALASLTNYSLLCTFNAMVAEASEYTFRKTGKKMDGSMYSCTSFGMKAGGGLGSGISGWLLSVSGFSAEAAVQTAGCNQMLIFMFAGIPFIVTVVSTILFYFLKVEKVNAQLRDMETVI